MSSDIYITNYVQGLTNYILVPRELYIEAHDGQGAHATIVNESATNS